jgi:pimeloyl-ACP methyl ester carboxylesterase
MKTTLELIIDDLTFEVLIIGDRQKQPVLFIHGFGASAACISPSQAVLDQLGIYIIAVNRPGTGRSTFFKPTGIAAYLAYLVRVLDELGAGRVILLGWSAGGIFAQAFAARYPERVRQLSLVSSAIPLYNPCSRKVLPLKWKIIPAVNRLLPGVARKLFSGMAGKMRKAPDQVLRQSFRQLPPSDQRVADQLENYALLRQAGLRATGRRARVRTSTCWLCAAGKSFRWPDITAPTLIWHGTEDTSWPLAFAYYLNGQIKNSQLRVLEKHGHLLYLTQWNLILAAAVREMTTPANEPCFH